MQRRLRLVSLARGYGVTAECAESPDEIRTAFVDALARQGPTLLRVPVAPDVPALL